MSGFSCLYRRSSGIYAVRIVIPRRLRALVGKGEVHASTGLHDLGAAKLTALKIQTQWREKLMALDIQRLASAGALLNGEGLISIPEAAGALGMSVNTLLSELRNAGAELFTQAKHWQGWSIADLWDVERDYDGTFVLNDVERKGTQQSISSTVRAFNAPVTISALMTAGVATESVFRLSGHGGFWHASEVHIPLAAWMTSKPTLERIRSSLAGTLAPEAKKATGSTPTELPAGVMASDVITVKHGRKRFSELFELCKTHRSWGLDQRRRMTTEAGLFIELMGDPELGNIEVETIHEFANRLGKLPNDIYQSRRKYGVSSLTELMPIAERDGLVMKNERTVKGHVSKIAEILNYAKDKGMMHANPAGGYKRGFGASKAGRPQDAREAFTSAELELIFGQPWFAVGSGEFSASGLTQWRPHYYWLPLLALTTGGRLNELAQLYLDDVLQSEDGTWYLDFNLDGADKLDADDPDLGHDKSLKTVNAIRVVPLHAMLVEAGLPAYASALREAGYDRLFPELKRDAVKGYGKPAGSWFNERFLGQRLGIERNGKKTFHSFRHNFVTALERLDQSERVMTQLAGHERGKTQSGTRYAKDRDAGELKGIIDRLAYPCLAGLGAFDSKAGLKAIKAAMRRKSARPTPTTS